MDKPWLKHYPEGVPAEVRIDHQPSLTALLDADLARHGALPACRFMGSVLSHAGVDTAARSLAAWLQSQGLERGDRVALMLPNLPQYPVAVVAVLRAGGVVVNVSPLASARELEQQLRDCGAKALLAYEAYAAQLEPLLPKVPTRLVILTAAGDLLGRVRGALANHRARRGQVPHRLPDARRLREVLAAGAKLPLAPVATGPDDIAVLQYTGGTTGVSKGAVLLHRQLVANLLQSEAWFRPALARLRSDEPLVLVCALPLSHIYGFTTAMLLGLHLGGCTLLVPDARDPGATLKALAAQRFHVFPGTDALFQALLEHPDAAQVDWGALQLTLGGGMAVQATTARRWHELTGCAIVEGYGLAETSPSATCNPVDATAWNGSIGLPLPGTEVALLDDDGRPVPPGSSGEIAIRGPQVMAGYWQRPDETAKVMTPDGFFRTGDIGRVDERGYFRIVDRKKDMILVSGFNVYPNEVEDVIGQMPGVLECAAFGMPDPKAGEAVKVVVVKRDPGVTEADVRAFCEANLTGYKRPKVVEFRAALPKTPVGKVLRRELRDAA